MTNPSKGLLPQLVEVLYALADSQELLTHRIRTAHLELVQGPGGDESWRAAPLNPKVQAEHLFVSTDPIPGRDSVGLFVPGSTELSADLSGEPARADLSLGAAGNSHVPDDAEGVALPNMPMDATTSIDEPGDPDHPTPMQPSDFPVKGWDGTTTGPGDDGYNYFDELDARLAELGNLESRSEETGS